jgi:hypothetical protein
MIGCEPGFSVRRTDCFSLVAKREFGFVNGVIDVWNESSSHTLTSFLPIDLHGSLLCAQQWSNYR